MNGGLSSIDIENDQQKSEGNLVRHNSTKSSVLECRVCDNIFSSQGDKIPRLLFCGHTLCHSCLLRLQPSTEINAIYCPFDRQPTRLGANGVWDLKKNFALLEMIELVISEPGGSAGGGGSSSKGFSVAFLERERELSVCCDENETHLAVVYCTTCGTHLCEACSEMTHSTRTLAKHRRIPLSEKPKEKPKCPYHTSHVMEFTCLEIECQAAPLMCYICKDYGRHKGHQHNLLEIEAEKMRKNMVKSIEKLKKLMEDITETSRKLEVTQQIMVSPADGSRGTADKAKMRVRAYFQSLRDQLNVQEVAALTVVDAYIRERLCSIRQQEEDNDSVMAQVAAVCVHCEKVSRQDDARVLLAAAEIKEMLDTVENQRPDLIRSDEVPDGIVDITFTKDNRVHIGPKIEMRVIALGLDDSGKTSILFKLKQNEFVPTIPTIGFNVEELEYKNIKFTIWDVGGLHKIRSLWKHYYYNTQAVIFVLDSSNKDRMSEAKAELVKLISEDLLKDACFLILANNKSPEDGSGSRSAGGINMTIEEITNEFSLYKLCCGRSWHVQECNAKTGDGLMDGLDWLSRQLVAAGVQDVSSLSP